MKEVLLLLFTELLAQPCRACLLCFTPEFDKVLVSLANRCLGASLCQIRELSATGWFAQVAWDFGISNIDFPSLSHIAWAIQPCWPTLPPPLDKVFPLKQEERKNQDWMIFICRLLSFDLINSRYRATVPLKLSAISISYLSSCDCDLHISIYF